MASEHFSGDQSRTATAECPRCGSTKTKFCYYNNYNKSQPRHFCKACKRHWTRGGALRNIPAARRRRNKRHHRPSATPAPPRVENFLAPSSLSTHLQNDMSDILYQALARSSSPSTADCIGMVVPQCTILESHGTTYEPRNQNAEFSFSTAFNYQFSGDTAEESTVTTSAAPPPTAVIPGMLWNWNSEIDYLGSSLWDDFDADFKPIFGG